MPPFLTCAQGHRWEPAETNGGRTPELEILCPVCGAAARWETANGPAETPAEVAEPPAGGAGPARPSPGWEESIDGRAETLPLGDNARWPLPWDAPRVAGYEVLSL